MLWDLAMTDVCLRFDFTSQELSCVFEMQSINVTDASSFVAQMHSVPTFVFAVLVVALLSLAKLWSFPLAD